MYLDLSGYRLAQGPNDHPRARVLKYYAFSERERTLPPARLPDPAVLEALPEPAGFSALTQAAVCSTQVGMVLSLPDMYVGPGGVAFDPALKLAFYHGNDHQDCGLGSPQREYKVGRMDRVFPLLVRWGWSWQHFMQDLLDTLVLARDTLLDNPDVVILIDGQPCFAHFEPIVRERLGLSNPLLTFNHAVGDPQSDELLLAREVLLGLYLPIRNMSSPVPKAVRWARECLVGQAGAGRAPRDLVLVVSRRDAKNARRVANEEELVAALTWLGQQRQAGWRVMRFSPPEHDLEQTMELFARAAAVVGMHGGGNYNLIFAPPRTLVVECLSGDSPHSCRAMSAALGHNYWAVPLPGVSHYQPSVSLPVETIVRIVDENLTVPVARPAAPPLGRRMPGQAG